MKIHNTTLYFLENYHPTEHFLQDYFEKFSSHFTEYFLYHCKHPDEKIKAAIKRHPEKMNTIKEVNEKIEGFIHEVAAAYRQKYSVEFTRDVHLIVGAFGSNAYTHRQIIPEITFCLEKLSPEDTQLKVIVAHEFGHALHNAISDEAGMDWSKLDWVHPYTWLLQEGCATYFSKQIVEADEEVYFSYDESGKEWLEFAEANQREILDAFLKDLSECTPNEIFYEWFSINGGTKFGHTRFAYYIGFKALQYLIGKYGVHEAVTVWKKPTFSVEMREALLAIG